MGKKKIMIQNSDVNASLYEAIELVLSDKKSKYVEMTLNLIKNNILTRNEETQDMINYLCKELNIDNTIFNGMSKIKLMMLFKYIDLFSIDNIKTINRFIELNERGFIDNKDVTSYKSFDELFYQISAAEIKELEKDVSKDIIRHFEDDEWLIIRPLSWLSSIKYGSSTRWCTASKNNPNSFFDYSREGILLYCLNKKTGNHVAVFKRSIYNVELTFWNILDNRIDSMESGLPSYILDVIKGILNENIINYNMLTEEQRQKEQEYILKWEMNNMVKESPRTYPINYPELPMNDRLTEPVASI